MATRLVNVDRDTALLLPPDMREWVPVDHLVHFILDAVEQLEPTVAAIVPEAGPLAAALVDSGF